MESGKFSSVIELAQHLKSDRSNVVRTLSLVNLAPDIITAIMTGKAPETLALTKLIYGFPESWQEQREAILCCIVRYSDQCKKLKKVALYIPFSISMVYKKCNADGNYLLVPQRTEKKRENLRFLKILKDAENLANL